MQLDIGEFFGIALLVRINKTEKSLSLLSCAKVVRLITKHCSLSLNQSAEVAAAVLAVQW